MCPLERLDVVDMLYIHHFPLFFVLAERLAFPEV